MRIRNRLKPRFIGLLTACVWLLASPALADIWGFIDEKGVGHFSSTRVDERYELFSKEVSASDAAASQLGSDPLSAKAFNCGSELGSDPKCLPSPAPASRLSPKLAAFFEASTTLKTVRPYMQAAAKLHNLDVELLQALIAAESGFNTTAISPKGALGLMQLMPPTAARYGVPLDKKPHVGITQQQRLFNAQTNIGAGSRYLRDLLNLFNGKLDLALAAYNAGEGAVQRAGNKIPNYPETQNYVRTVTQMYTALKPPPVPQPAPVVLPEPKRPASPDPLRPIRGRGNGLPTSLDLVPPLRSRGDVAQRQGGSSVPMPVASHFSQQPLCPLCGHFPYFAGANQVIVPPLRSRGDVSIADRGVLPCTRIAKEFT